MARAAVKVQTVRLEAIEGGARRPVVVPGFGDGRPPRALPAPPVSNAQLGMVVFMAFETMVFVALVTAYLVLRGKTFVWPPPDLPRLPLAVTWVNTAMLLFSAFTMWRASAAVRAGRPEGARSALVATAALGTGFLAVQGSEWVRLVRHGLTMSSGSYGSTFYTLIGLHAVHVVGAVLWLLAVLAIAERKGYGAKRSPGLTLCAMYWCYVSALWVFLFGLVYLY